ncbi:MAG: glycosyltransferase family 39 protein [Deltaproteobacteria bacterium]|nr:glycosyltransferase family 39 protein [Deltaproteobacteria bacterium]
MPRLLPMLAATAVLAGSLARVYHLGQSCFAHDELEILKALGATPLAVAAGSGTLATWAQSVAYDELTLRLPVAICGILALVVFWAAGRRIFGLLPASFAAAGLAWSALQVAASRRVDAFAVETLASGVVLMLFCHSVARRRTVVSFAFIAAAAGAAFVSPTASCLLAAMFLGVLVLWFSRHRAAEGQLMLGAIGLLVAIAINHWRFGLVPKLTLLSGPWTVAELSTLSGSLVPQVSLVVAVLAVLGLVSARSRAAGGVVVWWVLVSLAVWIAAHCTARTSTPYVRAIEPGLWMLAGVGAAAFCEQAAKWFGGSVRDLLAAVLIAVPLWLEASSVVEVVRIAAPDWRQITQIVRRNWRPDEPIVVLHDRDAFVFYAPDLDSRVEAVSTPARAMVALGAIEHGWLIAPFAAHLYPGWGAVEEWMKRFAALDLSPSPQSCSLYFVGRNGHDDLLRRAEYFDLPAASLMHGSLLFDLVALEGASNSALWKVDQLALAPVEPQLRNPSLLNVVYLLAQRGDGDRAASLAYRLATAAPDWIEARGALEAFRPAAPRR